MTSLVTTRSTWKIACYVASYIESSRDAYRASTALRLTFMLGVSSSFSTDRSWSRIRKSLIVSQRFSWPLSSSRHLLHVVVDSGVGGQRLVVGGREALRPAPLGQRVGVQGDQGRCVVAAFGVHEHLAGQRTDRLELGLDRLRRDVLAAGGLDQVLLPVRDPQPPLVVECADVAGGEPAVGIQHLGRLVGKVVVAAHHAGDRGSGSPRRPRSSARSRRAGGPPPRTPGARGRRCRLRRRSRSARTPRSPSARPRGTRSATSFDSAALPETMKRIRPPSRARIFDSTSRSASECCSRSNRPGAALRPCGARRPGRSRRTPR